jgi:peptidoglycan/xylan/chitin deacetylase (PgdA/CDA1 family)
VATVPNKYILFLFFGLLLTLRLFSQKQLTITIDDPNTYQTPLLTSEERNDRILKALDKHHLTAALFVCGMRINDANGKNLLNTWDQKNHLICNHSFSHYYYNSNSKTAELFIQDFREATG